MLAPSCLTSLNDRRKTNTTHTVESRRNLKTFFALYCIRSTLFYTWHVQGSLHSCRPMICYVAWTLIPKSTTPVVPLHHFSRNTRKWAVLKSLSKRSVWLVSHTEMRCILSYLCFLAPSMASPAVLVMVWYTIYYNAQTPHIPGGLFKILYIMYNSIHMMSRCKAFRKFLYARQAGRPVFF